MTLDRRDLLQNGAALVALSGAQALAAPFANIAGPRSRLIFVNDLAGDIDGLFALAHAVLSTTSVLRGIVGTSTFSPYFNNESAPFAVKLAEEMLRLMGRAGKIPVHLGATERMPGPRLPVRTPGAEAIVAEAMRDDPGPLYVAVGGGLTEVASALLIEPRISGRFTLVWIGGDALPNGGTGETNFNIDPHAARYIYNETEIPIWQVTRAAYGQCTVSATELQAWVAPHGAIGRWLYDKVLNFPDKTRRMLNTGETWTLGDNPLVLLTSLNDWVPSSAQMPAGDGPRMPSRFVYERTQSSRYDEVAAPLFNPDGTFTARETGRKIRVYSQIDVRLMLGDFFSKMRVNFPKPG